MEVELDEDFETLSCERNKYIDKLTLELLLNKTSYQKYLSKTDPERFSEYREFAANCTRFRRDIMDITTKLLDTPDRNDCNQEVIDAFTSYSQTLIRYLEIKKMSDHNQTQSGSGSGSGSGDHYGDESDEDTMFPNSMNEEGDLHNNTLDVVQGGGGGGKRQAYLKEMFHVPSNLRK